MRSRRVYEYLAIMKKLEDSSDGLVRLRDIYKTLNIKPASAHEYLEKLLVKGYIEKIGRGEYRVSKRGERELILKMWAHGVIETYLNKIFGIDPNKACLIASRIDYLIPPEAIEKICVSLGHPTSCPHNHYIPHRDQEIIDKEKEYLECFVYNLTHRRVKEKK